jgi:RNA polymerase sigma-70 factor (ECF subfamily)
MTELAAPPTTATAALQIGHDRLDHLISRIAAGDRAAFRCLYAFMATRVLDSAVEARLSPNNAVAVTRSTFVEVWQLAGAASRYDARDWIAALGTRGVNDRLRTIDANGRHGARLDQPYVTADPKNQPPTAGDYDTRIHRELIDLLGAGGATIRISPGVFARIDDLDHALATIAATRTAATVSCPSAAPPSATAPSTRDEGISHAHRQG